MVIALFVSISSITILRPATVLGDAGKEKPICFSSSMFSLHLTATVRANHLAAQRIVGGIYLLAVLRCEESLLNGIKDF